MKIRNRRLPKRIADPRIAQALSSMSNFGRDLEKLLPPLHRSQLCSKVLLSALWRKWLLLSWVFSRLHDFNRSRFFKARKRLNTRHQAKLDSACAYSELEAALTQYQIAVLAKLNSSSSKSSSVSQELADLIVSKYAPSQILVRVPSRLKRAPGSHLRVLAEFLFSPKEYSEIFEPILRDLFDEYCEALAAARHRKSCWVRIRGYWAFWSAIGAQLPISTAKMVYKFWKAIR